jgi:DNA-directed RNA polymerase subunit RPC12/RpoP
MPITVVCPSCTTKLKASDNAAGRKTKCPKCSSVLTVPEAVPPVAVVPQKTFRFLCPACAAPYDLPEQRAGEKINCEKCAQRIQVPAPPSASPQLNKTVLGRLPDPPQSTAEAIQAPSSIPNPVAAPDASPPNEPVGKGKRRDDDDGDDDRPRKRRRRADDDEEEGSLRRRPWKRSVTAYALGTWAAGAGLLLLDLSPLFRWMNFGSGGVVGLVTGGGQIILCANLVATAVYITAMIRRKWLTPVILGVQAWGTLAFFWMGILIWKVGSILNSSDVKANPFAGLLATQISPGAGLYLGLIGGLGVAGALGFIAVLRLLRTGNLKLYYATQGASCVLGLLLIFVVGPNRPPTDETEKKGNDPFANQGNPFLGAKKADPQIAEEKKKWKASHGISEKQWDDLIFNYYVRKPQPLTFTPTHISRLGLHRNDLTVKGWWDEAKSRTPAQLDKLYPPLEPHEWYRAVWPGGGSRSNLDFSDKINVLVVVVVETERDVPIKELYGHLAFLKDGQIVYETKLAEKPKLSFTDTHRVILRVPYDDGNEKNRTLRFAKDNELTPVFTVTKVVLADGKEKIFGNPVPDPDGGKAAPKDNGEAPPPKEAKAPLPKDEPEWADASKGSVELGQVRVRVQSVVVDFVKFKQGGPSKDKQLLITLQVDNVDANRKVAFLGWGSSKFFGEKGGPQLRDNFGNKYNRNEVGWTNQIDGQVGRVSVYPGKSITDLVVFEVPVEAVEHLRLELPASNFEGTGKLRLQIPKTMIQR